MDYAEIISRFEPLDEYSTITNAWVEDINIYKGKLYVVFGYEIRDESVNPDMFFSETAEIPAEEIQKYLSTSKS